ncbi:hypothetical protein GCM10010404_80980 [Nonomuraea africana]|uniref:Uncharacterized protein n=1 Tax=Nonomuraea africana TaxID=46171 RepID=A0ABR9KWV7_9ACTN|nr:hypothetical protein [Nonomuraea africana]MBE1566524.1 hypothetical protein [Nonomuraea africana]
MITSRNLAQQLAEDLHVAVALGEYTVENALRALDILTAFGDVEQLHIYRAADPMGQANSWTRLQDGTIRPEWGNARKIWNHQHGPQKGVKVLPDLINTWGYEIAHFAQ